MAGNLARRGGVVPLLIGVAVLSAASYFLLFAPKLAEVRRLQAEVRAREAEAGEALRHLAEAAGSPGDRVRRDEERARAWRERVPASPEIDRLMEQLSREAVRHRLRDFRLTAGSASEVPGDAGAEAALGPAGAGEADRARAVPEREANRGFGEIRLRMAFSSGYKELAAFLDALPRMRRLVAIRAMTVREREGRMEASIDVSAFWKEKL